MSLTTVDTQAWQAGFETLEGVCPEEVELEVHGTLPVEGTLHRTGPARHDIGGERTAHWFDGDAAVHAVRLEGGRAFYRSRWIETMQSRAEQAAGRRLYGGAFWAPPKGGPIARVRRAIPRSAGGINVVGFGGRLLALSEGGPPVRLDPITLETLGEDDLGGALGKRAGFSAHPKVDKATGECWNFGVTYGATTKLSVYRGTPDGAWSVRATHTLAHPHMVHDMALTAQSVVIVCSPFVLPRIPLALLTGRKGYGQSLRWRPKLGTTVVVVDRASGEVRTHVIEPFFVFHIARAEETDEELSIDLCSYPDAGLVAALADVMKGKMTAHHPTFERVTIDARGHATRRALTDAPIEFPRPTRDGATVGVTYGDGAAFINTPCVTTAAGTTTAATLSAAEFSGEAVPVGDYIVSVVLDARVGRSELRVFPADLGPAVATVTLPYRVPFGLHGNFTRL